MPSDNITNIELNTKVTKDAEIGLRLYFENMNNRKYIITKETYKRLLNILKKYNIERVFETQGFRIFKKGTYVHKPVTIIETDRILKETNLIIFTIVDKEVRRDLQDFRSTLIEYENKAQ